MTKPSLDRVADMLSVDTASGEILWRRSRGRAAAGSIAGRTDAYGYTEIQLDGQSLKAHQLVWFVATGDWAPLIDHIDGNRANNAFANLREADAATNARNRTNWQHRKLLGAFPSVGGKFAASITADGVRVHLGVFDTEAEAHERYASVRKACEEAERAARQEILRRHEARRATA